MRSVYTAPAEDARPGLAPIAGIFARDANLTWGGGTATAETLRREIVERRQYVGEHDFRLAYAASRLTPGTNLLALCAVLGWNMCGVDGALVALFASSLPSAALATLVMAEFQQASTNATLAAASRGAIAVAAALLVSSAWVLVRPNIQRDRVRSIAIVGASWFLYQVVGLSTLLVLSVAASCGAFWRERHVS